MTELVDATKGYTATTGNTGVYEVEGGPTTSLKLEDVFADGQKHAFYITDGTDFELIWGQYAVLGKTITTLELESSSNGGDPVVWGPGQKEISAVARAKDLVRDPYFPPLPIPRPFVIGMLAQSNGLCAEAAADPLPYNPLIRYFGTNGSGGTQTDDPEWLIPDFENPALKGDYNLFQGYLGYIGGARGNIALSCAYQHALKRGCMVYVIMYCKGGEPISGFEAGGEMITKFNEYLAAALATPELQAWGITAPDMMIWDDGETNAIPNTVDSVPPPEFSDRWQVIRADFDATWGTKDMPWYLCGLSQYSNWTGPSPWRWNGIERTVRDAGQLVHFVDTKNVEVIAGQELHFTGNGCNQLGENVSQLSLRETFPSSSQVDTWDQVANPDYENSTEVDVHNANRGGRVGIGTDGDPAKLGKGPSTIRAFPQAATEDQVIQTFATNEGNLVAELLGNDAQKLLKLLQNGRLAIKSVYDADNAKSAAVICSNVDDPGVADETDFRAYLALGGYDPGNNDATWASPIQNIVGPPADGSHGIDAGQGLMPGSGGAAYWAVMSPDDPTTILAQLFFSTVNSTWWFSNHNVGCIKFINGQAERALYVDFYGVLRAGLVPPYLVGETRKKVTVTNSTAWTDISTLTLASGEKWEVEFKVWARRTDAYNVYRGSIDAVVCNASGSQVSASTVYGKAGSTDLDMRVFPDAGGVIRFQVKGNTAEIWNFEADVRRRDISAI